MPDMPEIPDKPERPDIPDSPASAINDHAPGDSDGGESELLAIAM